MDWKAHLVFGAAFGAAVCYLAVGSDAPSLALFSGVSGFSALLPDLDLRKSKASKIAYAAIAVALVAAAVWLSGGDMGKFAAYLAGMGLVLLFADWLVRPRHRGIMHSMLFLAVAAIAVLLLAGWFFAAAFAAGYFSHLVADNSVKIR